MNCICKIFVIGILFINCGNKINKNKNFGSREELSAYPHKLKGNIHYKESRYHEAIIEYEKAIELDPYYDTAYYNKGNAVKKMGEYQKAIDAYSNAIRINHQFTDAYFNRGNTRFSMNDIEGALNDFSKVIELNPNFVSAYYNRGYIFSDLGREDEALKDYEKALEVAPKPLQAEAVDMLSNIGLIYYDRQDFKRALEYYNQAIEVAPNDGDLYYNRGLAKKRLNDKDGACEDWKKASSLGFFQANILLKICDE